MIMQREKRASLFTHAADYDDTFIYREQEQEREKPYKKERGERRRNESRAEGRDFPDRTGEKKVS